MTIDLQPTTGLKDSIDQRRAARAFRSDPIPEVILERNLASRIAVALWL